MNTECRGSVGERLSKIRFLGQDFEARVADRERFDR